MTAPTLTPAHLLRRHGGLSPAAATVIGLALLVLLGLVYLAAGTPWLDPVTLGHALGGNGHETIRVLVWQARAPRFVIGVAGGALLGLAGLLLQDAMRNPLAGPELLGVSSGSAAVMAGIITLGIPVPATVQPWLAFAGGAAGGVLVVWGARRQHDGLGIILIGMAVSAGLNAVITTLISLSSQANAALFYTYLVGTLNARGWNQALVILPWLATALVAAALGRCIGILRLGDAEATGLGVHTRSLRITVLLLAVAAVCAVVAVCGPIGYVSLLAPHLARRVCRTDQTHRILPITLVVGALLLAGADLLARTAFSPLEMPAGIWTTLLGGPLLLILLGNSVGA